MQQVALHMHSGSVWAGPLMCPITRYIAPGAIEAPCRRPHKSSMRVGFMRACPLCLAAAPLAASERAPGQPRGRFLNRIALQRCS